MITGSNGDTGWFLQSATSIKLTYLYLYSSLNFFNLGLYKPYTNRVTQILMNTPKKLNAK